MSRHACRTASIVLLAPFVRVGPAEACQCGFSGPACQTFWTTDAVFDATVTGIETLKEPRYSPDLEPIRIVIQQGRPGDR